MELGHRHTGNAEPVRNATLLAEIKQTFPPGANVSVVVFARERGMSSAQVYSGALELIAQETRGHAFQTGATTPDARAEAALGWVMQQQAPYEEVYTRLVAESAAYDEGIIVRQQAGLTESAKVLLEEQTGVVMHAKNVAANPIFVALQNTSIALRQNMDIL